MNYFDNSYQIAIAAVQKPACSRIRRWQLAFLGAEINGMPLPILFDRENTQCQFALWYSGQGTIPVDSVRLGDTSGASD